MAKYSYSTDGVNRLVIRQGRKAQALKGSFSIDKDNILNFTADEPLHWRRQPSAASRIIFKGKWRINENHDLELVLDKAKDQAEGGRLILKGEIISVDSNELAFEVVSGDSSSGKSFQLLRLSGTWQADDYNRICFQVTKRPVADTLVFQADWKVNKNNQLTYVYEKSLLAEKAKSRRVITFEGFWQINDKNRIRYLLEHGSGSYFEFKVQCESPDLHPKQGEIRYRLGIGQKIGREKQVCLYGAWKFNRGIGLVYEMDYGKGRVKSISFGLNLTLAERNKLTFSLLNSENKPLGLAITFNHSIPF